MRIHLFLLFFLLIPCRAAWSHDEEHDPPVYPLSNLYRPTPLPDRIVLTWEHEPATSQTVTWRTDGSIHRGFAEIAVADPSPYFFLSAVRVKAETEHLKGQLGEAHYHSAQFQDLKPGTKYIYRVGDGTNWSEWLQFETAQSEPEPFTFVYFGDSQNQLRTYWSRVVREAYRDAPKAAFFLHAGDLVNQANSDQEWGEWYDSGSHIHRMTPCVAVPGNHEYKSGVLSQFWKPTFAFPTNGPESLPETAYWFDYQGTRFIALDSNRQHKEQATWVAEVLENNPNRWTIVTFHHPMYSSGQGRDNPHLREHWLPLFDKHHVDLVLQGHDHTYSRSGLMTMENVATGVRKQSDVGGTVYVVSVSGPKMYKLDRKPFMKRAAEDTQLYQIIRVEHDQLRYEARTAIGTLYDGFTLRKQDSGLNQLIEQAPETEERRRSF